MPKLDEDLLYTLTQWHDNKRTLSRSQVWTNFGKGVVLIGFLLYYITLKIVETTNKMKTKKKLNKFRQELLAQREKTKAIE